MKQVAAQSDVLILPFSIHTPELLRGAAQVYASTWNRSWNDSYSYILKQAQSYPDFYGYVAATKGRVIGLAFGTRSQPGFWWHDQVAGHVGAGHPALQDAWVLAEFAVLRDYRSRGTGSRLHDTLLAAQPYAHLLLSTELTNYRARKFYEERDWHYLHPGFAFNPGAPLFVIMYKSLLRENELKEA